MSSKSARFPLHPRLRSVCSEFPPGNLCTENPGHRKVCASEGSSRLTLTSTTLLTWAPRECCCSRQKPHHRLRQCTYHHVRNSWMWQEYHVPHNWKGSDFSAEREWLNSLCYSTMGAYKLHGQGLKKKSCLMMTVPILLVPSGCTIPALHIRLCTHSDRGSMLLSLGSVVQRPSLGMASAATHVHTAPLLHRASETQINPNHWDMPSSLCHCLGGQQQLVDT